MFKHYYFVTLSVRNYTFSVAEKYMFVRCRAKDLYKEIKAQLPEGTEFGINTISKLD